MKNKQKNRLTNYRDKLVTENKQASTTRKDDKTTVMEITQLIAEEKVIQIKITEIIISMDITTDTLITTTAVIMGITIRADMVHTRLILAVIEAETVMDEISMAIMDNKIIIIEVTLDATRVASLIT